MNSVDTGWVTDENHTPKRLCKQEERDFFAPLGIVDGMALHRVSVMVPEPVFESAYRTVLASMDVYGPVVRSVYRAALSALEPDPNATRRIVEHLYGHPIQ
jgi:DNA gyrase/topoisomerase IV subunit B